RQYRNVGPRPASRYEFQTKLIQKTCQRIREVNNQGKLIHLLRPSSEIPVNVCRHPVPCYPFIRSITSCVSRVPLLTSDEDMPEPNPLLEIQFPVPFDKIKASHVEPAIQELLTRARERLEALGSASNNRPLTFDATLMELDAITENVDYAMGVVHHLE